MSWGSQDKRKWRQISDGVNIFTKRIAGCGGCDGKVQDLVVQFNFFNPMTLNMDLKQAKK